MSPFFGRRRRERELDEEIRAHFRMAVEERVACGESHEDAERAVRREFGNEARVREVTRTARIVGLHGTRPARRSDPADRGAERRVAAAPRAIPLSRPVSDSSAPTVGGRAPRLTGPTGASQPTR
jgi:hypothetical protein